MSDRYESQGVALIQFYGWLRETGEIDRLVDLVIEKVRDSRQTERAKDPEPVPAESRAAKLEEALREIANVNPYTEICVAEECRDSPKLRRGEWCPRCLARAALAGGEK